MFEDAGASDHTANKDQQEDHSRFMSNLQLLQGRRSIHFNASTIFRGRPPGDQPVHSIPLIRRHEVSASDR
jgi:hypothetical protein